MTLDTLIKKLQALKKEGVSGSSPICLDDDTQYWQIVRRGRAAAVEAAKDEDDKSIVVINIGELD